MGEKRILLIDDDPEVLKLFGGKLVEAGFFVSYAKDGDEGMVVARDVKPDLIVVDMVLPRINGLEFLEVLRADPELQKIPVVFLSSVQNHPEDVKAVQELGALGILHKTMNVTDFVAEIKKFLS